jgi:hypothetical protein
MREIPLTRGKATMVDDDDYERLSKHKWYAFEDRKTFYACRGISFPKDRTIWMHREIMDTPSGMETDHKDGNGLNNQKYNLRICSRSQNAMNIKIRGDNTSGYKGVYRSTHDTKWVAQIIINSKNIYLGSFENKSMAAIAYNEAAYQYFGEFARLNLIKRFSLTPKIRVPELISFL